MRGPSRIDRVREALARTQAWLSTSAIASRCGLERINDVLGALRDLGEVEQRKDPAGSHDKEWRRVAQHEGTRVPTHFNDRGTVE